jgi:hypothetical protein
LKIGGEGVAGIEALPEPAFEFLFGITLEVEAPDIIGQTYTGNRRMVGVRGACSRAPGSRAG